MSKQRQDGYHGSNCQEPKIPLYIDAFDHQVLPPPQRTINSALQYMRWPDQKDSIGDDDLMFDEVGYSKRKAGGQAAVFQEMNLQQEMSGPTRFESPRKRQALHSNSVYGRRNNDESSFVPARPGPTAGEAAHHHAASFSTRYAKLMFSAYSINGWTGSGTSKLASLPCHHINNLEEPVLLTLSSFPFRIVYANDALFDCLQITTKIVGLPFFDCFHVPSNVLAMKPCLARSDVILRLLLNGIGCTMPAKHHESSWEMTKPCFVKAHPVVTMNPIVVGAEQIGFFAMRVEELRNGSSEPTILPATNHPFRQRIMADQSPIF